MFSGRCKMFTSISGKGEKSCDRKLMVGDDQS